MSENEQTELDKEIARVSKDADLSPEQKGRQIELLKLEAKNKELNAQRSGVGTRLMASMTRGRGTAVISYEGFDKGIPESLPKSLKEFNAIAKFDEPKVLSACIDAFNADAYSQASDPINEFVNSKWSAEDKAKFKASVKAISSAQTDLDLAGIVGMIKPLFDKKYA